MDSDLKGKIRLRFSKRGSLKFISHHDVMRLFERAARRAGLPVRMTSGFNPHPRFSFPLALGLGVEGLAEVAEMELCEWLPAESVKSKMNENLPPQIRIDSALTVPPRQRVAVSDVTYEITPPELTRAHMRAVREFLGAHEVLAERKGKSGRRQINVRRFVLDMKVNHDRIKVWVAVRPEGTVKPAELLCGLGIENPCGVLVTRSCVNLLTGAAAKRQGTSR